MIVRTSLIALAALGLAGAMQTASAQQDTLPAATESAQPTLTAQATPQQIAPEAPATATPTSAPLAAAQATPAVENTTPAQCRWRRQERKGLEFVLLPLDIVREGLSALRRGTVTSC